MKIIFRFAVVAALFVLLAAEPTRLTEASSVHINNATDVATESSKQPPLTSEQVEKPVEQPKTAPTPVPKPQSLIGSEYDLLRQAGVPENQLASAKALIQRESSWRLTATNYLGCIGLGQACPGGIKSVLLANCPDWQTNAVCQLKTFTTYVNVRYGGWNQAKAFSDVRNWY